MHLEGGTNRNRAIMLQNQGLYESMRGMAWLGKKVINVLLREYDDWAE